MRAMAVRKQDLERLYLHEKKTDVEIAKTHGVDRTRITQLRKLYGIPTRKHTGQLGEEIALKELKKREFIVTDMNKSDATHPFDILINERVRVDVKTTFVDPFGFFCFKFTDKSRSGTIVSDVRIKLPNGKFKKLFTKTCDVLLLVGVIENHAPRFFLIPSNHIPDRQQSVSIPSYQVNSKYFVYENRWDFLINQ